MKIGLFLLYAFLAFFISLTVCFTLRGGIEIKKDPFGFNRLNIKGQLDFYDWAKSVVLALVAGFCAGLAPVSGIWGIIVFLVALGAMGYICYWAAFSADAASEIKEIIVFIGLSVVFFFIARMGSIAAGATIRSFKFLKFLRVIPGMSLTACIAIIIASTLNYRAGGGHLTNDEVLLEKDAKAYRISAIAVVIVGAIIVLAIMINALV